MEASHEFGLSLYHETSHLLQSHHAYFASMMELLRRNETLTKSTGLTHAHTRTRTCHHACHPHLHLPPFTLAAYQAEHLVIAAHILFLHARRSRNRMQIVYAVVRAACHLR